MIQNIFEIFFAPDACPGTTLFIFLSEETFLKITLNNGNVVATKQNALSFLLIIISVTRYILCNILPDLCNNAKSV